MGGRPHRPHDVDDIFRPRFERAFDAHHADVLAFAIRRVEPRAAAEDVVSETFAVVWRRREGIPDAPLPWLYEIARRVIANQRRAAKRGERLRSRLQLESGGGSSSRDPAQLAGEREAVLAAFSRLSEGEREVLALVAWDEVDAEAAAQILDCAPGTFRVRLHRARRELRRQLEAEEPGLGPKAGQRGGAEWDCPETAKTVEETR